MDCSKCDETHYVRCLKCQKIIKCSRYDTTTLLNHIRTDHPEIEIVESGSPSRNSGSPTMGIRTASTKPARMEPVPPGVVGMGSAVGDCHRGVEGGGGGGGGNVLAGTRNSRFSDDRIGRNMISVAIEQEAIAPDSERPLSEIKMCDSPLKRDKPQKECGYGDDNNDGHDDSAKTFYTRKYKSSTGPSITKTNAPRRNALYRTSIEKWRPAYGTIYCPNCGQQKRPMIKARSERISQNSCGAACLLSCWPFCFLPFLCNGTEEKEYLHCANCKCFLGLYDRMHNCIKPNREFVENSESKRYDENGSAFS